jgi:transcriptional regulator with GAF, ATPase, and Fis domain
MAPLSLLYKLNHALASAKDTSSLFHNTMSVLNSVMEVKNGLLAFLDTGKGEVVIEEVYGLELQGVKGNRCRIDEGKSGEVIRLGNPMTISDISEEPILQMAKKEIQHSGLSLMCAPLKCGDISLGILGIDNPRNSAVNEGLELLNTFTSIISPTLLIMRWSEETSLDEILRRKLETAVERMDLHTESQGSLMADVISLVERTLIVNALRKADYVQLTAARFLGINRNTLRKKIKELAISFP